MNHLQAQRAARRRPWDQSLCDRLAESLRVMIADMSRRILRDMRGTAELREEIESVGFEAAWTKLSDILTSDYDDERQLLWHVEKIARPKMEVARDSRYKPCGIGHDRRREIVREIEQNCREQEAGHKLPEAHQRAGGGVEYRNSLNGSEAWNRASDDPEDRRRERERSAKRKLWAKWFAAEVDIALCDEPLWLAKAVGLAMRDRQFGIGERRRPNVSAIAAEVGVKRDVLRAGLWRLACRVAADAPDYAEVNGTPINPNKIGRRELPDLWPKAVAVGEAMRLPELLFGAA